ncbi:FAD binding domain-containing protein [Anaeromicrobium sediminis]|uniref:FAD-binding protein n=1 Tax=Anaeromicrobium sediminis TaxID=1478221 RepID=A0A267MGG2_9FIRM|nr:FAD binding domain-containing protein [Anaeromicrobium sediminis]PAB58557.1 FAD-binding protein [Anaeromicrobium sediminis]
MITIKDYAIPTNLEEAYETLQNRRNNVILGGCSFLRMGSKNINTAIDLSKLNLDFISETDNTVEIGAMATFRSLETSPILQNNFNGILSKCVKDIVGIQFRNNVTLGATVYSKYGFSDLITALLCLDVKVCLHKGGIIPLDTFLENKYEKDILTKIIISKDSSKCYFASMRNSHSDYAILNVALSNRDGQWKISVGARPMKAQIANNASSYLSENELNDYTIEYACELSSQELVFGSNLRASKKFRQEICKVLINRGIREVMTWK